MCLCSFSTSTNDISPASKFSLSFDGRSSLRLCTIKFVKYFKWRIVLNVTLVHVADSLLNTTSPISSSVNDLQQTPSSSQEITPLVYSSSSKLSTFNFRTERNLYFDLMNFVSVYSSDQYTTNSKIVSTLPCTFLFFLSLYYVTLVCVTEFFLFTDTTQTSLTFTLFKIFNWSVSFSFK